MNQPSLTAPMGTNSNKTIAPEGMHVARIYQIIDLGTTEQGGDYPGKKRKVQILFELPNETSVFDQAKGAQPFYAKSLYTLSMNSKAILRKDVESLLGKTMDDKEAYSFNIFNLIGKECMVQIVHAKKGDNTYANIKTITPMPKGINCPPPFNEAMVFSTQQPDMNVFNKLHDFIQDKIKLSDEFMAFMNVPKNKLMQHFEEVPKNEIPEVQDSSFDMPWDLDNIKPPF